MEPIRSFQTIIEQVKTQDKKTVVVAAAQQYGVIAATVQAKQEGLANIIHTGDEQRIRQIAQEHELDISGIEIIHETDAEQAVRKAIEQVSANRAHVLMKGKLNTGQILGKVLKDETLKIRQQYTFLSHLSVFEWQGRLRIFSDAGLNIAPNLEQKKQIALNAIKVAHKLGIECPRVAILSASEKVSPKMQSSIDGAALAEMSWDGAIVGGPLAFDGAMFEEAYEIKGVPSPVEGKADIIICPNIETGNSLYKAFSWMMQLDTTGIVVGAAVPVVITSRSDSARIKFLSIVTSLFLAK